jgi:hypothetical protein
MDILEIPQVEQGPQISVAAQDDMPTPAPISAIRTSLWVELGTHEMRAACSTMATPAKNPDLIYKI